jgi:hypothetical protein
LQVLVLHLMCSASSLDTTLLAPCNHSCYACMGMMHPQLDVPHSTMLLLVWFNLNNNHSL